MSYRPGNIVHVEIPAPDLQAMQTFYGRLFAWTFKSLHAGYVLFDAGNLAGGLMANAEPSEKGSLISIKVVSVAAKLAEAASSGGRILQPETPVPGGRGRYGYFADPCGNKIGLWMDE